MEIDKMLPKGEKIMLKIKYKKQEYINMLEEDNRKKQEYINMLEEKNRINEEKLKNRFFWKGKK